MSSTPPRCFNVKPVETSFRPAVAALQAENSKPARRFVPEPIDTTARSRRRPTPTPIDTQSFSRPNSTDSVDSSPECHSRPRQVKARRSREKFAQEWESQLDCQMDWEKTEPDQTHCEGKPVRRSRERFAEDWEAQTVKENDPSGKRAPRRFKPQLLETARRSRRAGDGPSKSFTSGSPAEHVTDAKWSHRVRRRTPPPPPVNTPTVDMPDMSHNPLFLEIQRATSPLTRRRPSWASLRSQHSFRVPDLDPIESSESEPPSPASPVMSRSYTSNRSHAYTDITRYESHEEKPSGPLLELAAKSAEKQLREQAMAAFPNEDHHEHVDHFIDRLSSDEIDFGNLGTGRRESCFAESNPEFLVMQRHRQKMERQAEAAREKKDSLDFHGFNDSISPTHIALAPLNTSAANNLDEVPIDGELSPMRKSARPPMLGSDIEFPRCPSPEPANFDPTQGCDAAKMAIGYLTKQQSHEAETGESLWCGNRSPSARPSLYSTPNSISNSRSPSHGGLWGGCCAKTGLTPPRGPTGLLTPRVDFTAPHSPCPTPASAMAILPPTPPPSNHDFAHIDQRLATEATIAEEFGDDFVTQVYNYLSLGYPSIARMFDEELSKISHIPVSELRQDDHLPSSRGYIRLGEDGNLKDSHITEETCMRWRALREYIRVWARQHPNMAPESPVGSKTAVRKGSWAV